MEITQRQKLEKLNEELKTWAIRHKEARLKYGQAVYDLGLIIASHNIIPERMSFENKVMELLKIDKSESIKSMWNDYKNEYQKYKAAELVWKSIESEINSIKFINRPIV